ncbi:hypothetical protein vseg_007111 [Gypsophila vaccaria]
MMNVILPTSSKYTSSGCESGWTLYLQHSTTTTSSSFATSGEKQHQKLQIMPNKYDNQNVVINNNDCYLFRDNEEEDLSMVSDASSGPPHFDHYDIGDDDDNDDSSVRFIRKQCMKSYALHETHHQCCSDGSDNDNGDDDDDDTASSHVFTSKKIGGIHHVQNNIEGASIERFIDYSSQSYSTTHFKVDLDRRN